MGRPEAEVEEQEQEEQGRRKRKRRRRRRRGKATKCLWSAARCGVQEAASEISDEAILITISDSEVYCKIIINSKWDYDLVTYR
ncbi:hypothetical protein V1477_009315 [Vespula maculifrons]|uniref:Uncharacterized protein n=1 Tax=Vespula maculifrons TaxID=7453 RepID=A0ABD2C9F0_VESMC